MTSRYLGLNITLEILAVFNSFKINNKISYFTLNNANNNNTTIEVIRATLSFNRVKRRGYYFNYILNLATKVILFSKNTDAFKEQLSSAAALTKAEYKL